MILTGTPGLAICAIIAATIIALMLALNAWAGGR